MKIGSAVDYRLAARAKLPRFLFDYIDGGSYSEYTLKANQQALEILSLRQRVLKKIENLSTKTTIFGEDLSIPLILAPVGITGMYAKRGEVQAANACANKNIPFTLSTVSICSIDEVAKQTRRPIWFQLYVLKDRGFMKHVLDKAHALGITNLVFTADMPTPGARYRDIHSGMSGPYAKTRRLLQALFKPSWAFNVGLMGRPHDLGNVSSYLNKSTGLEDYIGWLNKNFDPSISWSDLEWLRDYWPGNIIIKGILDVMDAQEALNFGADGIVVSNHGGRQLDGVLPTAKALPDIVNAVGDKLTILADSGVRSGLDIVRMLALGAKAVMVGRPAVYALAAQGQKGVENLIDIMTQEMSVAMTLTGAANVKQIDNSSLVDKADISN